MTVWTDTVSINSIWSESSAPTSVWTSPVASTLSWVNKSLTALYDSSFLYDVSLISYDGNISWIDVSSPSTTWSVA